MDRRSFLQRSIAAGSFAASTALSRSLCAGMSMPGERVRVGFVGAGGRALSLVKSFSAQPDVDVVALADLDPSHVAPALAHIQQRQPTAPSVHADFRRLVDDDSIDALVVGTPDHWHAIPTILGCLAGKDVYVEKPDGHNMLEGQRMVAAAKHNGRIVQLGTQARSAQFMLDAIDYIRSGNIGRALVAKAWETNQQGDIGRPPDGQPPAGVDYDMWLGPAPSRPFNPRRFHGNWRWFFDYGSGDIGNDGVHRLDYARWGLEAAAAAHGETLPALPRTISAIGGKWHFDDMQEWPDTLQANFAYAGVDDRPGRILTYEMRLWSPHRMYGETEAAAVYGDAGYVVLSHAGWRAYRGRDELVVDAKADNADIAHARNFVDCVKSRERPNADLETVGHPASLVCHTANVAWRLGRTLTLDADSETFVDDAEANALRTRAEYRRPWLLPEA